MKSHWDQTLCSCTPCGACCLGTFCPCMLYGRISSKFTNPTDSDGCNSACCCYCVAQIFGFGCCLVMNKRSDVRNRYHIEGGCCGDLCAASCCHCCALVQMDNEITVRNMPVLVSPAAMAMMRP